MDPGAPLPPGFRAVGCTGDPFVAATAHAADGGDPGTVLFAPLGARCAIAIVLCPDRPITDRAMIDLGLSAAQAALAGLAPSGIPIGIEGSAVTVNGGVAAGLRVARSTLAAQGIPDWLVLGIDVAVKLDDPDPGANPGRTCLAEEGFEVSAVDVMAATCRHLLASIDAWSDQGGARVAA